MADRRIKKEIGLKRMVEWKKLGDVCDFQNGFAFKSNLFKSHGEPIVRITNISSNKVDMSDSKFFLIGDYSNFNLNPFLVKYGDILLAMSGATTGKIGMFKGNKNAYLNQRVGKFVPHRDVLDNGYLFHFLLGQTNTLYIMAGGGAQPNLSSTKLMEELNIPMPSLSEQNRIVGILDTFTASIENLKEQITQRRKQYEHYRDQLLDLEGKEGVERIILKDVCEVINGRAYSQPELLSKGKYRILRVGNFFSNDSWYYSDLELENKYYCEKGDLLYAWSASFGPHIWEEEKVIYHYHIWKMNCSAQINKKFMFYWLQSEDMRRQAFSNLHGATMAHLTKALMESLMVPVPSISEQSRIVSILDTFEASIQNLEAQLKEREKQYEYYRNKLLTFE